MSTNTSHSFGRHLLATNLVLLIILVLYNLLGYFLPLVGLSWGGYLLVLLVINLVLLGLRIITNRQSQP